MKITYLFTYVVVVASDKTKPIINSVSKNSQNCFCFNYVKFLSILTIFGTKMAKTIELCKMQSFSILFDVCQHTTVSNTDDPILHNAKLFLQ